jgi:prophage DNA circulation protein
MATPDTYSAMLANIPVEILAKGIEDDFDWALAKHEYPNRNGASIENMGQKGRPIKCTLCFYGDNYDLHFELLESIKANNERVAFIHPIYGTIYGSCEHLGVRHDDSEEMAEIDLVFMEDSLPPQPTIQPRVDGQVEDEFLSGQEENMAQAETDAAAALGSESKGVVATTLDASKGLMEQFSSVSGAARSFVAQIDAAVAVLEKTLDTVTQPANGIIATVNYKATLSGRIVGVVASAVERYAVAYSSLKSNPAQFSRSLRSGLYVLEQVFADFQSTSPAGSAKATSETTAMGMVAKQVNLATSQRLALEAGYAFKDDQVVRKARQSKEKQKSFDLLGNYLNPVALDPIMNVRDIEAVLATVMTAAQRSIDAARESANIKRAVAALVDHARKIKLEAEKIKSVEVQGTIPIHLLCLQYGLPYNAAERILAINPQIKHPNFVSGMVKIYVP